MVNERDVSDEPAARYDGGALDLAGGLMFALDVLPVRHRAGRGVGAVERQRRACLTSSRPGAAARVTSWWRA